MFKQFSQIAYAILLICACLAPSLRAAEIIFRPAPGLNDGSDTGTAEAGKDAGGGACDNPAKNYGIDPVIGAEPISDCNSCNSSMWVRFDVSMLPTDVVSVHVGFAHEPHTYYCLSNCNADFYFYPVTSEWNEIQVSLASPPSRGVPSVGPINITFPNDFGTKEYDITDMYRQWKTNPTENFGIEISSTTVGCNNASVFFAVKSSDNTDPALRPYLRIETSETSDYCFATVDYLGNTNDRIRLTHPSDSGATNGATHQVIVTVLAPDGTVRGNPITLDFTERETEARTMKQIFDAAGLNIYDGQSRGNIIQLASATGFLVSGTVQQGSQIVPLIFRCHLTPPPLPPGS